MTHRIVATLTTLPDRYHILLPCLESLHVQDVKLDAIYLTLPKKAERLNKEYPELPEEILQLCTVVKIERDFGPITKLYGALVSEHDPETIIICSDDDVIHQPNLISTLLRHHEEYPDSAICGTGALFGRGLFFTSIYSSLEQFKWLSGFIGPEIDENGRNVDMVLGVAGVLYRRGFFPSKDELYDEIFRHSLEDKIIFRNDDVLISGYLCKQGIKRRVFADIPTVHIPEDHREDALSFDVFKMIEGVGTAIERVQVLGFFSQMEPLPLDETPAWKTTVVIVFLVFLGILCWAYITV